MIATKSTILQNSTEVHFSNCRLPEMDKYLINNLKKCWFNKVCIQSLDFKCLALNVSYEGKSRKAVRNARK